MSQLDNSQPPHPEAEGENESTGRRMVKQADFYQAKDIEIYVTPGASNRKRADGGMDETHRIQFVHALTEQHMCEIARRLLAMPEEAARFGFTALTKLEFLEPDICDYRFWCAKFHSDRLAAHWELWARIHNEICPVYSVDGVRYWFLTKEKRNP
jgi:hypothetical protein